jgi:hypothetical protein
MRQNRSTLLSGLVVPLAGVAGSVPTGGLSLAAMSLWYPLLAWRYARAARRRGLPPADAWLYAAHCVLSSFPQLVGMGRYVGSRLRRLPGRIIEYKGPTPAA